MSTLTWPWTRRRPRPFIRFNRGDYERQIRALELQRDLAVGEKRAVRDAMASWLEARAAGFLEDSRHMERLHATPGDGQLSAMQRRAVAHELQQAALELEGFPTS